jgi:hypothetical protein
MIVPLPTYTDLRISDNQSVFDIVKQVKLAIKKGHKQAKHIYSELKKQSNSDIDLIYNTWKLAKSKITYQKEPIEKQTAKEFARIWHEPYGDCKHFTIFIASILYNDPKIKDKIRLRIINHNGKSYTHIYPIILTGNSNYITADGTASNFNKEAKYLKKIDFKI